MRAAKEFQLVREREMDPPGVEARGIFHVQTGRGEAAERGTGVAEVGRCKPRLAQGKTFTVRQLRLLGLVLKTPLAAFSAVFAASLRARCTHGTTGVVPTVR